ncbi:PAP2 (acid phosphatase) superfamily protein [Bhargavaea cecembensis DSE10]|uniref:PAP2 (Acid phosphatase) superfamily protein n=1 Tax=Bhargavaea cecembensis DSE10 TaxID=1235279 RepID=M7NIU9_9BACL|nr:phosphatase PAP2 family protein [Bhargavaea cecembensis]EMR07071.1 PAP2 (acid phosphatase) superfamily protein [Bhargavaea cecembensis DSE10]
MKNNKRKVWAAVAATVLFVLLAVFYESSPMQAFDRTLSGWLGDAGFLEGFSFFGNPSTIFAVCLTVIVLLLIRHSPRDALFILLAVGVGYAINEGLKEWFGRPRPEMEGQLESHSFPSGHAQMGLLYVSSIGIIAMRRIRSIYWRRAIPAVAGILIAGMGLSRIALGRHYATDVLAGWSVGTAYLLLLLILFSYWNRDRIQS